MCEGVDMELLRRGHLDRQLVSVLRRMLGLRHAHRAGYGWRWDPATLVRVPDLAEREQLALIAELRQAGSSFSAIAQELARRGIVTAAGHPWSHDRVRRVYRAAQ